MPDSKRKLAAYLHDPPEKAYDYGDHHKERASVHAASFGVAELWRSMGGSPDWSAAAADRFVFPHGSKVHESLGEPTRTVFVHPMSGRGEGGAPALPAGSLRYPGQDDAEAWLSEIRPEWKSEDPQTLFLRAWRKWSDHAADHATGRGKGAELLPYLPADTRIPDGSIWHHCAVASALEATRVEASGPLQPAFLVFQVGPVQEFIAQARSTRDLWSGSYLLSWLTMHAIKAVADRCGPDAIIFPSLKGQPLYDFLERRLDTKPDQRAVLVPGIPNRFLALVPQGFDAEKAVTKAFQDEWELIARECRDWLRSAGLPFDQHHQRLWDEQVDRHWQITWQLCSWQNAENALAAFNALPLGMNNPIHLAKTIAQIIPDAHKDERCYRDGRLDPGWAWSVHYQLCQHALDARRSLRDFHGLPTDPARKPGHRDALSGREEAVVQADALEEAANKHSDLRHLFRHADPLGAANLIKRVWHKAYLERLNQVPGKEHLAALPRARESFDSVPSVAAGAWLAALERRLADDQELWFALTALSQSLAAAKPHLHGVSIGDEVGRDSRATESRWLGQTEAEVLTERFWQQLALETEAGPEVRRAASKVREFKQQSRLGEPPSYYAVLALDGDQIGKWLSGEKSPAVGEVISAKARDYFERAMLPAMTEGDQRKFAEALQSLLSAGNAPEKPSDWEGHWPPESAEDWIRAWLASPRPLSPSWHLQFSEALASFGLYAARRIVEDVHHGQLIYSGGDDVLAMLPADEGLACATDLRAAFQGRLDDMSDQCHQLFRAEAPEGFLWLANPKPGEPTWPLLVPGPRMTVSVGLAIGHVKEPLQDMIQEAQRAEKRAKNKLDRNAIAATLFKRSGETIEWGAKFSAKSRLLSAPLRLLRFIQSGDRYRLPFGCCGFEPPISGKFPYRVAELLRRYQDYEHRDGFPDYSKPVPLNAEVRSIAEKEFDWVVGQQAARLPGHDKDQLRQLAAACLNELEAARQPLLQFINLFLLEAFIRRQAD